MLVSATLPEIESAGKAVWPIDPHEVVAAFEPPDCDYCAGHRGIDLAALPLGTVRSALAGTVTYAGSLAGRGVIVVDDGVRRVTYEPVAASVRKGSTVSAGDRIGEMELIGSHCYPEACLHLGLIDDETDDYLDPMSLFGDRAEVRLLPLWTDSPAWTEPPQVLIPTRGDAPGGTPAAAAPN